jgi:peptidoglycan biosynthesis protein MviN/MurJ (putative lipid II flippase)
VDKVRLFWCLVLILALSLAVAALSWAAGELADGAEFAFDNLLDGTLVIATGTTLLSAVLLMIFAPAVFHERYEQTRVPHEETRVRRNLGNRS